ncbi:hypothetical protein E2C01_027271 [Portunus trituberculatus]|uniref:RNA-directed DNA polymerase from mobile element jockey n=1 Tax=Portunus trituberculatus TaxID=210409 RepID=A0A5B7ELH6_PORTR|nr:hypothetical protein [Portunus trituberculatus]
MFALVQPDDDNGVPITKGELLRALSKGKASSPGDDGVTYAVLRLLQKVPGNPLLRLFDLCLRDGHLPQAWTSSTILPISEPCTTNSGPSLLLHPFASTHHCLVDLYSCLSRDSVLAFVDLKSPFDVANRDPPRWELPCRGGWACMPL